MFKRKIILLGVLLLLATAIFNFGTGTGTAVADESVKVIAQGLNNPRGLAFAQNGALYVAEAGVGGAGPCMPGPEGGDVCYGDSSSITRIHHGQQTRVVTGLSSLAAPDGSAAIGAHKISIVGRLAYVTIGLGADPAVLNDPNGLGGVHNHLGELLKVDLRRGNLLSIGDLAAFEATNNPAGGPLDSNPYGVLALSGRQLVTDAGGNSLLVVRGGNVETMAVFPTRLADAPPFLGLPPGTQIPMESVPTAVVQGPDGAFYISELTGFPFPFGGSQIYRVEPGAAPTVYATGFTNVIDLAFAPDGTLFVLEITTNSLLSGDPTGALIRVNTDGSREIVLQDGLLFPGGVAVGPDGALYVTNGSIFPGGGMVLRIAP